MNDIPRQKLKELIQRFGTSLSEDRLRCLGMLMDVCGDCKREIAGIVAALDEKIPAEILKPDFTVVITRKLLIKKLEENRAIAHEVAAWAVDSWAIALGVITESQIPARDEANTPNKTTQITPQPQPTAPPQEQPQVIRTPTPQPQSVMSLQGQRKQELSIDIGRGVRLELVHIPAGRFKMGSQQYPDEQPIHEVSVGEFYLSKYPITQVQYQKLMGNNPSFFNGGSLPVECVNWHEAREFCQKLSVQTGKQYRLPSEAEWEYACRAGSTTAWHFGDDEGKLGDYAWYSKNSGSKTHPVGEKKPNGWGLYDMNGNVWEWCEDVWHKNYNGAPNNGRAWTQGGNQTYRMLRGGSWYSLSDGCRSASRFTSNPDYKSMSSGFRVVVS